MSTTSAISNMRAASMPKVTSGGSSPVSAQHKISNMFKQIDSTGTGSITKEQFEQAFNKLNLPASVKGMGLEAAFSKLDPTGTGVVSKQDFIKNMGSLMTTVSSAQHKDVAHEAKAAAGNMATQSSSSNIPPPPAGGPIGNTINIAA